MCSPMFKYNFARLYFQWINELNATLLACLPEEPLHLNKLTMTRYTRSNILYNCLDSASNTKGIHQIFRDIKWFCMLEQRNLCRRWLFIQNLLEKMEHPRDNDLDIHSIANQVEKSWRTTCSFHPVLNNPKHCTTLCQSVS